MAFVENFLRSNGFGDGIIGIFEENGVDTEEVLDSINETDLKEFGLNFGQRRRLIIAINRRKAETVAEDQETTATTSAVPVIKAPNLNVKKGNNSSQSFKVADILKSDPKDGDEILQKLENEEVDLSLRRRIVKIMTRYLTEKTGDLYPRSQEKEAMARALVGEFPCLKDLTPGCEGHELYYKDGAGFIEYRLKTVRQSAKRPSSRLEATGRPAKTAKPNDKEVDADEEVTTEVLEQMEWLKYHPPTRENQAQIRNYLKSTFTYRQSKWSEEGPSVTTILTELPRFRDMPELINLEFDMLYPGSGSQMLVKWTPFFVPKLIQLAQEPGRRYNDLDVFNILLEKLPTVMSKNLKTKGRTLFSFIVQYRPSGTDVEAFSKSKDKTYSQPFILALGDGTDGSPTEYFLIVDSTSIPGGKSGVEAFDRLFKLHYIFNVEFAKPLITFFNFFEGLVYKITPKSIRPTVRELYSQMMRVDATDKED